MKTFSKYIYILFLIPAFIVISGCSDDLLYGPKNGFYPDGQTIVHVKLDFEPFSNIENISRGDNGKLMDRLDDLCVVVYDKDGKLLDGFPVEITKEEHNLTEPVGEKRNPEDASNGDLAESSTLHTSFDMILPYGEFYIYGVANLGEIESDGTRQKTIDVLNGSRFADIIGEREKFLGAKMSWSSNMLNNCEMLGYFTTEKEKKQPFTSKDMNDVKVSIDKAHMSLHSWLRRCASKVTVSFDGSGLLDNIRVYIKRVTIHDIPDCCALGRKNVANGEDTKIITYKTVVPGNDDENYRPTSDANSIVFGEGDDHLNWPYIANGSPYIMDGDKPKDLHAEDAEALFLYENMQGEGLNDKTDKEQKPTDDGLVEGAGDESYDKDNMEFGSYIEVEGYYDMSSNKVVSQGKIIYRFMLGKDVLRNFDVERNYHYKITMCVRGYGNDVDWHIEYKEDTGFEVRDPYYVSYLYNHDSTIRFRYTPPEGYEVESLDAEIVGNNWWPTGANTDVDTQAKNLQTPFESLNEELNNYEKAKFTRNKYTATEIEDIGSDDKDKLKGKTKYLGNGFLSLRQTDEKLKILPLEVVTDKFSLVDDANQWTKHTKNQYMNDTYFYGIKVNTPKSQAQQNVVDRSKRTYYFNGETDTSNTGREAYNVEKDGGNSLKFNLPVFTRAKNLVKESGYTGNNPYEAFSRHAFIRITAHCRKKDDTTQKRDESQIIRVEQVPRITNPKGIYRESGKNENFEVTLTKKISDNGSEFEAFKSDGPWMAEVLGDDNFINLNGKSTIKGTSDSEIAFTVRFNKMNRDKKVRNAVIRVRYHNYSCVHLIFVRQGYAAQNIVPGGKQWHTCNLICDGVEGDDPRDEGSLFKFGNLDTPIDVSSNVYEPVGLAPSKSNFNIPDALNIATGKEQNAFTEDGKKWTEFKGNNNGFTDTKIATMSDFETLYLGDEIQQGFGVLYADGATETQYETSKVYGWCRHTSPTAERDKCGICGVFIYYWNKDNNAVAENYRSIFFPIGRSGYGHRKHWDGGDTRNGVLRYACGRIEEFPTSAAQWMPLFHDLYMRKGAIYWAQKITSAKDIAENDNGEAAGLDMNFFTFDVNLITRSNIQKHSQWSGCKDEAHFDACFLRRAD